MSENIITLRERLSQIIDESDNYYVKTEAAELILDGMEIEAKIMTNFVLDVVDIPTPKSSENLMSEIIAHHWKCQQLFDRHNALMKIDNYENKEFITNVWIFIFCCIVGFIIFAFSIF